MRIFQPSDIFMAPAGPNEAVCVTTNGIIRKDGRAVMGRGIALEADKRFSLAVDLAGLLKLTGNHVYDMGVRTDRKTGRQMRVITFPTKHHWKDMSDLRLIRTSAEELKTVAGALGLNKVYLTKPGCANGGLDWESQVRPVLENVLTDDRFIILDWH